MNALTRKVLQYIIPSVYRWLFGQNEHALCGICIWAAWPQKMRARHHYLERSCDFRFRIMQHTGFSPWLILAKVTSLPFREIPLIYPKLLLCAPILHPGKNGACILLAKNPTTGSRGNIICTLSVDWSTDAGTRKHVRSFKAFNEAVKSEWNDGDRRNNDNDDDDHNNNNDDDDDDDDDDNGGGGDDDDDDDDDDNGDDNNNNDSEW